jgi:hypothetical protein
MQDLSNSFPKERATEQEICSGFNMIRQILRYYSVEYTWLEDQDFAQVDIISETTRTRSAIP